MRKFAGGDLLPVEGPSALAEDSIATERQIAQGYRAAALRLAPFLSAPQTTES